MRQLASIQQIESLTPIEGADAIEVARVLGWNVVVKKGEHVAGDKIVYCEVDSLLPERPEFEFLRSHCYKAPIVNKGGEVMLRGGFRVKTIKLRGQVSQGICFPLDVCSLAVAPYSAEPVPVLPVRVGDDVTDLLGIVKYEVPEDLGGMPGVKRSTFPDFIPKTDETRVQNLGTLLYASSGQRFVMTEKLDGTSFTAFMRGDTFGVCSRNQSLDPNDTTHMLCALAAKLGLADRMRDLQRGAGDIAIQGEVVGPSIQGNKYALMEHKLFVFNVYLISAMEYAAPSTERSIAHSMGLETVPLLSQPDFVLNHSIDEMVALSQGKSALNPKVEREGIVCRPVTATKDGKGNRVSFKAINPKFLLKYE